MPDNPTPEELAAASTSEPPLPAELGAAFDAAGAPEVAATAPTMLPGTDSVSTVSGATGEVLMPGSPVDVVAGGGMPGGGSLPPDGAAAVAAVSGAAEPGTAAVVVAPSGDSAAVVVGADKGGGLQLSENVGPATTIIYKRSPSLKADPALVKLLVPEARLKELLEEIADLEKAAAQLQRGSQLLVTELIDRLASARNRLLHNRDQYENALREVVYVRYRLTRIRHSSLLEQPQTILVYLVIILVLLIVAFLATPQLVAGLAAQEVAGIAALTLFNTAFWGALGGLAAAFFALQRHVEDFDQQHARWYYLSPMVGLFIGPLMGLVAGLGLPAFFQLVNEQPASMEVRPALLYLLAWTVGYQQNLLLELIRSVLTRSLPDTPVEDPKTDPPIR